MRLAAIPPLLTASLYLAMGAFVLHQLRPREKNALAYSLWLFTTVYWQVGWAIVFSLKDPAWIPFLIRLNYTGIVFIPIAFYHLYVTFLNSERDAHWLRAAYGTGFLFAIACWIDGWMVDGYYRYSWGFYARAGKIHPLYLIFLTTLVVRVLFLLTKARPRTEASPSERQQLYLLRAAFFCYLPAAFDFSINYGLPCYPIGFIFTLISLALVSYAIVKHHLFDIRLIIRKAVVYSAVTIVLTVIYVSVLVVFARILEGLGITHNIYSSAIGAAIIAILVQPVRSRIQQWVDRRFPRESLHHALLREATSGFAHEIKRPLVNISMPAQLALSDLDDLASNENIRPEAFLKVRERLHYILRQAHEAAEKIEAIRELSMEGAPAREEVDLGQVLMRALASEDERLKKGHVEVRVRIPEHLPSVSGNRHQLEIALANVLRNAGEAMQSLPAGQRMLRCELREVLGFIEVQIVDSGPGITPKEASRLFEPWFSTKGAQGMGIGLYITQEIIHRHRGTIEVTSDEGRESVFRITIPLTS